ncbi:MAG: type II secretion system F family protein [Candidatus Saccharimonas sp.]|nr:type II secretion system F family protein [Planctomycetaceae bacterium]
MEVLIGVSIVLLPLALFVIALGLRIAADAQPETSWSGPRRRTLFLLSYLFVGIGLFVLLATAMLGRPLALIAFVMLVMAATQLAEAELKLSGSRRRAQEAELLWMLATSVLSHRNLADDVEAYARGSWGKRHTRLLELADRLRRGLPRSELAVPQGLLSRTATLEIQAGIQSGKLAESLRNAAIKHTRQLTDGSQSLDGHSAVTYPAAVLTVMVLILGFLMYWIIPKFKKIFDDFGTELPGMTIALINGSDVFVNYWYLAAPVIYLMGATVVTVAMAHFYGWRELWQRWAGRWTVRPHASDVLRSLASIVEMGAPIERALDPFVTSSGPIRLQQRAAAIRLGLSQGLSCWELLAREGFLKPNEVALIETAQRAGNLPWALVALADNLDRRWLYRLKAGIELLRPMAILALGAIVGFVVIAMFLPLIKLLNDLS